MKRKICSFGKRESGRMKRKLNYSEGTQRQVFCEKNGTAFQKHNTINTVKFGDCFIMIWGCFSFKGTGELQVIMGRIMVACTVRFKRRNFRNLQLLLDMVGISCFHTTMIPSISQNLQKKWFENNGISTPIWIQVSLLKNGVK